MLDPGRIDDVIDWSCFKSKPGKFFLKCGNKFLSCLVEFVSPSQVFAEEMDGKAPDEYAANSVKKPDKCFVHMTIGFLYVVVSAIAGMFLYSGLLQFSWCNLALEANERIARTGGAQRMGH